MKEGEREERSRWDYCSPVSSSSDLSLAPDDYQYFSPCGGGVSIRIPYTDDANRT
jgi:hypothetical protein